VFVRTVEGNKKDCESKEANDFDSQKDYSFIRSREERPERIQRKKHLTRGSQDVL
jgi:hypothetical protein